MFNLGSISQVRVSSLEWAMSRHIARHWMIQHHQIPPEWWTQNICQMVSFSTRKAHQQWIRRLKHAKWHSVHKKVQKTGWHSQMRSQQNQIWKLRNFPVIFWRKLKQRTSSWKPDEKCLDSGVLRCFGVHSLDFEKVTIPSPFSLEMERPFKHPWQETLFTPVSLHKSRCWRVATGFYYPLNTLQVPNEQFPIVPSTCIGFIIQFVHCAVCRRRLHYLPRAVFLPPILRSHFCPC